MNVLFALYGDLTCNSAAHVDALARELCGLGWGCAVAVPKPAEGTDRFGPAPYQLTSHAEAATGPWPFAGGRPPDVVHLWTPREILRKLHDQLAARHAVADGFPAFRSVIHLEDNEWHLTRGFIGTQAYDGLLSNPTVGSIPDILTHPALVRPLLERAAGFTLLIDRLGEFVPAGTPRITFWPAADSAVFAPRPRNNALRAEFGLEPDACVLAYHGNTHASNHREVRSLYLAVALLVSCGMRARLLRLGTDCYAEAYQPTPGYAEWSRDFVRELGFVTDRRQIANILACADVFVQPGAADPFNDYRFPSKLPEFFAFGRPVVLPRTNIGLVARHGIDAYVLDKADGSGIAGAVTAIRSDAALAERLSAGALAFAETQLSWPRAARRLAAFYQSLPARVPTSPSPETRAA